MSIGQGMCQIRCSSGPASVQPPGTFGSPRVRSLRLGPVFRRNIDRQERHTRSVAHWSGWEGPWGGKRFVLGRRGLTSKRILRRRGRPGFGNGFCQPGCTVLCSGMLRSGMLSSRSWNWEPNGALGWG